METPNAKTTLSHRPSVARQLLRLTPVLLLIALATHLAAGPYPAWIQLPALVTMVVSATAAVWIFDPVYPSSEGIGSLLVLIPLLVGGLWTEEWEKEKRAESSEMTLGTVERCVWTPFDYSALVTYDAEGTRYTALLAVSKGWSSCPPHVTVEYATGHPLTGHVRDDVITIPGPAVIEGLAPMPSRPESGE